MHKNKKNLRKTTRFFSSCFFFCFVLFVEAISYVSMAVGFVGGGGVVVFCGGDKREKT